MAARLAIFIPGGRGVTVGEFVHSGGALIHQGATGPARPPASGFLQQYPEGARLRGALPAEAGSSGAARGPLNAPPHGGRHRDRAVAGPPPPSAPGASRSRAEVPPLRTLAAGHWVACHFAEASQALLDEHLRHGT